jgi:hypothetical protein
MNGPYPTFERPNPSYAGSEPRRSLESPQAAHRGSPRQAPRGQHSQPQMRQGSNGSTPSEPRSPPPNARPTTYTAPDPRGSGTWTGSEQAVPREGRRSTDMRRSAHPDYPAPNASRSPPSTDPRYSEQGPPQERGYRSPPPPPQPIFGSQADAQQQQQQQQQEQRRQYYDDRRASSPGADGDADDFFAGREGEPYYDRSAAAQSIRDEPTPSVMGPLLDQSHLRPGVQAALLSHERTLELYRTNAKKVRVCYARSLVSFFRRRC